MGEIGSSVQGTKGQRLPARCLTIHLPLLPVPGSTRPPQERVGGYTIGKQSGGDGGGKEGGYAMGKQSGWKGRRIEGRVEGRSHDGV
jgi:hypothetical protein